MRLDPKHLAHIAESGLDRKDAKARGIHTMSGGDRYAIPFHDIDGKPTGFVRWRQFGEPKPYGQKAAPGTHIYFDPTINWRKVAKNAKRRIVVTEGERKAMALCKAGIAAIGITGKDCWHDKSTRELHSELASFVWQDRPVEVLPDSDQEWKSHVRRSFLEAGDAFAKAGAAVAFRVLPTLSGQAKTGADDFLVAQGKDAYDLLPLHPANCSYIGEWRKSVGAVGTLLKLDLATVPHSWAVEKPPPTPYLIDPLIPEGVVAVVGGPSSVGKTFVSLLLGMSVACGARFLGLPTKKGRVVYLAMEDPKNILQTRYHWIRAKYADSLDCAKLEANFSITSLLGKDLQLLQMQNGTVAHSPQLFGLIEDLRSVAPTLVVLDPMARLHGLEENANGVGTKIINACEHIASELGCSVILSHHTGKANAANKNDDQYGLRGGSSITDAARAILILHKIEGKEFGKYTFTEEQQTAGVLKLTHAKNSYGPRYKDVWFKKVEHGVPEHFQPELNGNADDWAKSLRLWAQARKGGPFTRRNVTDAKIGGHSREHIEALFNAAVKSGDLVATGENRRGGPLYLATNTKGKTNG